MKIDFGKTINGLDGEPIKRGPDAVLTLEDATITALTGQAAGDEKMSGDAKFDLFKLALKCKGETELTVSEVANIKERIGKVYTHPVIVGRCWELLEGSA